MRRTRLKFGVYEERYRPECKTCGLKWPECKHSKEPKRVVMLAGPDQIWCHLNGTNYPSVRFHNFNDFESVEMVMTDTQFRSKFVYLGRCVTQIKRTEIIVAKKGK